jgi:hypothetical protein
MEGVVYCLLRVFHGYGALPSLDGVNTVARPYLRTLTKRHSLNKPLKLTNTVNMLITKGPRINPTSTRSSIPLPLDPNSPNSPIHQQPQPNNPTTVH